MLGASIFGPDPLSFSRELFERLRADPTLPGTAVFSGFLSGHPLASSRFWREFAHRELPPAGRHVASLEGGLEGFLSRRSPNFRSRLKRTVNKVLAAGAEPEFWPNAPDQAQTEQLWSRVLKVEQSSWKGLAGRGIDGSNMESFYRRMLPLLGRHNGVRGLFLTRDGQDLAYLFGGVCGRRFRGLQFSYRDTEKEGLGNVCQFLMLEKLCEEGCQVYDLGQAMPYKARWADENLQSRTFVVQLRR